MAFSRILVRKSFCKLFTKHLWWSSLLAKFYDFDIFLWAHLDGWSEGWKWVINESCKSFLGNKRTKSNASSCFSIWRALKLRARKFRCQEIKFPGSGGEGLSWFLTLWKSCNLWKNYCWCKIFEYECYVVLLKTVICKVHIMFTTIHFQN